MIKKKRTTLIIALAVCIILGAVLKIYGPTAGQTQYATDDKSLDKYTWEAYQAMSAEEKEVFYQSFDSAADFEAWMELAKPAEDTVPVFQWDESGKLPSEYAWEEYQALTLEEQDAFYQWFASAADFEAWMAAVKPEETTEPDLVWDKPGKLPDAYTWVEYQELSPEDKDAFFRWFASEEAFAVWMNGVKPAESMVSVAVWEDSEKWPSEYTWEEYQDLDYANKEAFYHWFDSVTAFEAWMESVKPEENTTPAILWNKPGKQPSDYTWKEYQKLSPEDQDAFFQWFGSVAAFESWMNTAEMAENESNKTSWSNTGKQPNEYTWEEYQALSPEDQDAFYRWFGSVQAFEAWRDTANPENSAMTETVWNKLNKQPDEYTWEEYQLLTPEEQELFFQWFASADAFEVWLEQANADTNMYPGSGWNKLGKNPDQYTKEEYLALTPEEQDAFFLWFETLEAFEAWVNEVEKQ